MFKSNTADSLLIVAVVILAIVAGPLVNIWAINTLFPVLAIPYTFSTWLAALVVTALFTAKVGK